MERALGIPLAHNSTLKPAGTLSLSVGISLAGNAVMPGGCGTKFKATCSGVLPCAHVGGIAEAGGAAGACAKDALERTKPNASMVFCSVWVKGLSFTNVSF